MSSVAIHCRTLLCMTNQHLAKHFHTRKSKIIFSTHLWCCFSFPWFNVRFVRTIFCKHKKMTSSSIIKNVNIKSFASYVADRAALISVSLALSQTPAYTARPRRLVHRAVFLFTSQVSMVLIEPTHGGMARLSWLGWLVTCRDGLPACRWSPIQVLTRPGVD